MPRKKAVAKKDITQVNEWIVEAIENKKGSEITTIDISSISNAVCDYFIITHASSKRQVAAIADSIDELVKKNLNLDPSHIEGYDNSEWIVLDYFDVIVHIFLEEKRKFYQLEQLWGDAKIINHTKNKTKKING